MKLDRSVDGHPGKYAVVRLRRLDGTAPPEIKDALAKLVAGGFVVTGSPGAEDEFFVIMLRDKYADVALRAYAVAASGDDPEYADEVLALAKRAGRNHPSCKKPD